MEEIDVGDKVVVLDNSYAIKITEEGLEDGIPGGVRRKISPLYEVIATNKILPAYLDEVDKLILTIEEINNIKNIIKKNKILFFKIPPLRCNIS